MDGILNLVLLQATKTGKSASWLVPEDIRNYT
jgi:hypothetical protein